MRASAPSRVALAAKPRPTAPAPAPPGAGLPRQKVAASAPVLSSRGPALLQSEWAVAPGPPEAR